MTRSGDTPPLTRRAPRVAAARALSRASVRAEQGAFLAEGPQAVREALAAGDRVRELFATADAAIRHGATVAAAAGQDVPVTVVDDRAMALLSDTVTPAGLIAVCRTLDTPLADVLRGAPRLVAVLVEVRDPGNAGTVVRTADAAGADAVVFAGSTVDPYNGKLVRASAGSLFHLPVVRTADPGAVVEQLRAAGLAVLAAAGTGELDLDELADTGALQRPTAWLLGNEAHGLDTALAAAADARVRVPIRGRAESLNLAVAAAVLMYASARAQRPYRAG